MCEGKMQASSLVRIRSMSSLEGEEVRLRGWVGARRSGGRVSFVEVRDGSGDVQVVFSGSSLTDGVQEVLRSLTRESAVEVRGVVRRDARASAGFELEGLDISLISPSEEWPFSSQEVSADARIGERQLYLRSRRMGAILRLRALLSRVLRETLDSRGFLNVDAPIFTPNVVEESASLFDAPDASAIAYLSQSGQLYNEASALAFGQVYSFGPVFRSERKPTHRHLSEFWMLEPELAFGTMEDVIELSEAVVFAALSACVTEGRAWLEALGRDVAFLEACRPPYPRISYEEAVSRARAAGVMVNVGDDLDASAEAAITRPLATPVWVVGFPTAQKSFYMKRQAGNPDRVVAADLLAPEGYGEIMGGGEREESYAQLVENLRERGLDPDLFAWYLSLRKHGSVPHAGFGLGLERLLVWIAGLSAIDEAIAFPRLPTRQAP